MPQLTISPKLSIHYLEFNPTGVSTALLLHGLGATGESWGEQIPLLVKNGLRVLAPDARGFGSSSYPGGGVRVEDLAGDMLQLLDCSHVDRTHIVGISMGGALALQMVLDNPQRINKLVLINTFAALRPEKISVWFYFLLRFVLVHSLGLKTQAQAVAKRIFPAQDQSELRRMLVGQVLQADPQGYRAAMRALARFDVRSRLSEIRTPTLIVSGERDTTVPLNTQLSLARSIPGALHQIIPNAGHAVTVEKPAEFNKILLEFLCA